jgi:hypothetical protein
MQLIQAAIPRARTADPRDHLHRRDRDYVAAVDSQTRNIDRGLWVGETVIYVAVAVILWAGSALLVRQAVYELIEGLHDGIDTAAANTLDVLLLTSSSSF